MSLTVNPTTIAATRGHPSTPGRTLFRERGIVIINAFWTPDANRATTPGFSQDLPIPIEVPR